MKIKTSKYNEISFKEAVKFIKNPSQVIKPTAIVNGVKCEVPTNGVILGIVKYANGKEDSIYSDYEVRINNVQLSVVAGDDEYFSCEIELN